MMNLILRLPRVLRTFGFVGVAFAALPGTPAMAQSLGDLIDTLQGDGAEGVDAAAPAPESAPASEPADPQERVTPDIVTDETIDILQRDGLIAEMAEINEGLLLMDRRLRQAQLISQVMSVFGPDAPIEVAPGRFVDYSDTPEGKRQRIDMIDLELRLMEREAELAAALAAQEDDGGGDVAGMSPDALLALLPAPDAPQPQDVDPPEPEAVVDMAEGANGSGFVIREDDLREISGAGGEYMARLAVDTGTMVLRKGDELPNGQIVADVTMNSLVLAGPGGERQILSLGE